MHRKGIFFSLPVNETQYERLNGCLCLQRNDLVQQIECVGPVNELCMQYSTPLLVNRL